MPPPRRSTLPIALLGQLLRHVRTSLGWSIRDAADRTGIHRSKIQRVEVAAEDYVGAALEVLRAYHPHIENARRREDGGAAIVLLLAPEFAAIADDVREPNRAPFRTSATEALESLGAKIVRERHDRVEALFEDGRAVIDLDDRDAAFFGFGHNHLAGGLVAVEGEEPRSFARRITQRVSQLRAPPKS